MPENPPLPAVEDTLRAYFKAPPPKPPLKVESIIIALSLLFILAGLSISGGSHYTAGCAIMLAAPGLVAGFCALIVMAFKWSTYLGKCRDLSTQPTDVAVQKWLEERLERVKNYSLRILGVQLEELVSDPLMITGPVLWWANGISGDDLVWRKGLDTAVRFGVYRVAIIALTERHMGVFSCDYNFIKDVALNERTDEVHYRDIISVSTGEESTSLTLPSGEKLTTAQEFRVAIASGEAIRVTVDAPQIRQMTGADVLPSGGAEKAVRAIRAMLREKKS